MVWTLQRTHTLFLVRLYFRQGRPRGAAHGFRNRVSSVLVRYHLWCVGGTKHSCHTNPPHSLTQANVSLSSPVHRLSRSRTPLTPAWRRGDTPPGQARTPLLAGRQPALGTHHTHTHAHGVHGVLASDTARRQAAYRPSTYPLQSRTSLSVVVITGGYPCQTGAFPAFRFHAHSSEERLA